MQFLKISFSFSFSLAKSIFVLVLVVVHKNITACRRLADYVARPTFVALYASRRLQLNAAKSKVIWFGPSSCLCLSLPDDRTLSVNNVVLQLQLSGVVCDLGVLLDSELTTKQHVNSQKDRGANWLHFATLV